MKRTILVLTFAVLTILTASAQEILRYDTINQNGKQMIRKTVKTIADGKKIVTDSLFSDGRYLTATQMNWFAYEGQPMPKFEVKTEDGKTVTSESLRGKTIVISFWISSCGPCLKELKRVGPELIDQLPRDEFVFLAIGSGETAEKAKKFRERAEATFPLCYDETGKVVNSFADQGYPKLFVIDRDGIVRHTEKGYNDEKFDLLKQKIHEVMDTTSKTSL